LEDEASYQEAAGKIVRNGMCRIVVVTMGAGGALVVTGESSWRFNTPTVPIQSRVGAGDSMLAGIVLGLARGDPLEQAVLYGMAAGSAAVMTPGTELCRRRDTDTLYRQIQEKDHFMRKL
jgi:6-phosphofructokinase 2